MYTLDVRRWSPETKLLKGVEERTLFDLFDECAEVGSLGRKEQNEAEAKGAARDPTD